MPEINEQNSKKRGYDDSKVGGSSKQGAHGSGEFKQSNSGSGKNEAPKFQAASAVVGLPIEGEMDVPGVSIVKGASAVDFAKEKKGDKGSSLGDAVKKPKNAIDSGY